MKIESIRKTALIKRDGKGVFLLRLNLPRVEEKTDFSLRFNSFYGEIAEAYIKYAGKYVEREKNNLSALYRPLCLSLTWEHCMHREKNYRRKHFLFLKKKKTTCAFSQKERIYIKRTSLFQGKGGASQTAEYIDVFDCETGFLLE